MELKDKILRKEERIALQLRELYEEAGYQFLRLASFEDYRFYLEQKNFLSGGDVIKFTGSDGRLLALNPDVTLSIVKNTPSGASRQVYYNENVYRHIRKSDEYRQINQVGIEVLGEVDQETELKVVLLALQSLAKIGPGKLELSHSGLITAILDLFSTPLRGKVFTRIKNKNLPELAQLAIEDGIAKERIEQMIAMMKLSGDLFTMLPQVESVVADWPAAQKAVTELAQVVQALQEVALPEKVQLLFDLSTVNDTNYYSGLILQGFIENIPQALLFGGRYDGLLKALDKSQQAIGFGIHLDMLERCPDKPESKATTWLNVALPKGRMGQAVYELFRDAKLVSGNLLDDSRKLVFEDKNKQMRFFLVKPSDVASYVEHGAADIGIVGRDILLETKADVIDLLKFELGKCRIAVAGPKNFVVDGTRPLRVATKYPNITRKYFANRSQPVDLIYLNGSIELAPIVGLSDVIVDIVETGNTLRENDLAVLEEIDTSSARLIVNRASWRFKKTAIIEVVEKVSETK